VCYFSHLSSLILFIELISLNYRVPLTVLGDPNPIDPYPVRNALGASVGQIAGDGFSFSFVNVSYISFATEVQRG
jgi:hypothetical protein